MRKLFLIIPIILVSGYFAFRYFVPDRTGLYLSEDQTELSLLPDKKVVLKQQQSANALPGTYTISDGYLYLQFGASDVRRLEIRESAFVYDPDARMPQATPVPKPIYNDRWTPEKEAEYQRLGKQLGFLGPAATPRPKQTFQRVIPK